MKKLQSYTSKFEANLLYNGTELKKWGTESDSELTIRSFSDMCNEDLTVLFNGNLKVQYSLLYCQGDGLNIYGEVEAEEIFKCLEEHRAGTRFAQFENMLTDKEKKTILHYADECGKIKLKQNLRYSYSLADRIDVVDEWKYQLENYSCFKNINIEALQKFEKLVRGIFYKLCKDYEKNGYEYFYEVDEEELSEVCNINGWQFYENGKFYVA